MLEKERAALIAEIKRVFAGSTYPKKIHHRYDRLFDLEGKQWHELSVNDVLSNFYFFQFSPEGFQYFLPGYLVVMLENPEKVSSGFLIEGVLRHLGQDYDSAALKSDVCKLFDKKQRQTVLKFLDLFGLLWIPDEDIEKVLLRLDPKRRYKARIEIKEERRVLWEMVEKAKQYWKECK